MLPILNLLSFHVHVRIILSREVVTREGTEVHGIINYKGEQIDRESGTAVQSERV